MSKKHMATYNEKIQKLVEQYRKEGNPWPAQAIDIAAWAVRGGHWEPHRQTVLKQCAEDLARAMREEFITGPNGKRVRAKHAARETRGDKQMTFWGDIRTASRSAYAYCVPTAACTDCWRLLSTQNGCGLL